MVVHVCAGERHEAAVARFAGFRRRDVSCDFADTLITQAGVAAGAAVRYALMVHCRAGERDEILVARLARQRCLEVRGRFALALEFGAGVARRAS